MSDFLVASAFRRKIVVFAAAIVLGAVCASAQTKAAGGDEAGIAKVRAAYEKAAGTQDGAAIAKLYTADGVEMPPNGPAAKGRAAIEAFHKGFGQQWMMHGMTITATETKVHGDYAYDIGTYKQSLMPMKGGAVVDDHGKYVVLLKKDASGNWLVTHAIYNSDVPLPAPPAAKK
jgi:uncharacterized protein (TIGR02246 family)